MSLAFDPRSPLVSLARRVGDRGGWIMWCVDERPFAHVIVLGRRESVPDWLVA